jgi:hypothetical protein
MEERYLKNPEESNFEHGLRLIQIKCEENPNDLEWQDIVDILGLNIHRDSLRKACNTTSFSAYNVIKYFKDKELKSKVEKDIESNEDLSKMNYKNTIELNKDGSQTSDKLLKMSQEDSKDPKFLLKSHGYSTSEWELVSARNNIWNSYSKQDGIMTLYSSKITVKPLTEYKWNEEDIKKIFDSLKVDNKNKINIIPKQYDKNNNILVIPIADLHAGLLSDIFSNGNNYNLDIAEELFFSVINDVIENNKNKKYEKVVFVIGNDTTNSDNLSSTTTRGTPQQDSNLWFTIVKRVTKMLVKGIDSLVYIAPVDVVYVPSNHDLHTMFGIVQTLNAWYKDDENITVDTSPLPRKYYKFGKTTLALSHDVKVKEALKIVSTEAKDKWSDSNRVIFMLAHLHQAMEYEKQGILEILRLPTISGYSRWTNTQGYVQNERKNQSFVINGDLGIIDIHNTVFLNLHN